MHIGGGITFKPLHWVLGIENECGYLAFNIGPFRIYFFGPDV